MSGPGDRNGRLDPTADLERSAAPRAPSPQARPARDAARLGARLAERVPPGLPRFLLAGGAVSAINWLVRFPLSVVLPFWLAVALAYGVGMVCAFELYRRWVFPGSTLRLGAQVRRFVGVNFGGLTTVVAGAALLEALLRSLTPSASAAEALAHAIAIVAGAAVNFLGHRAITFARRRRG